MREFILRAFTDDEAEVCKRVGLEEIVRCKECKYWYPNGIGFCTIHDIRPSQLDMADWFCADGDRRDPCS